MSSPFTSKKRVLLLLNASWNQDLSTKALHPTLHHHSSTRVFDEESVELARVRAALIISSRESSSSAEKANVPIFCNDNSFYVPQTEKISSP